MFDNLTKLAKILGAVLGLLVSIKKSEQRKKFAYENLGEKKNISQIFHSIRSFLELQCSSDNSNLSILNSASLLQIYYLRKCRGDSDYC